MEVQRLLTALAMVKSDVIDEEIREELSAWNAAAQALVSSPADPATNDAFIQAGEKLKQSLSLARSNTASSSIRLALREVRLESLVGSELLKQVAGVLTSTPFLIARAAQAVQQLQQ